MLADLRIRRPPARASTTPTLNWSVSPLQREVADEAGAGGVSPVRVDVIGVPRVRADQPATPPVGSSGDTRRKVDVRASSISIC